MINICVINLETTSNPRCKNKTIQTETLAEQTRCITLGEKHRKVTNE